MRNLRGQMLATAMWLVCAHAFADEPRADAPVNVAPQPQPTQPQPAPVTPQPAPMPTPQLLFDVPPASPSHPPPNTTATPANMAVPPPPPATTPSPNHVAPVTYTTPPLAEIPAAAIVRSPGFHHHDSLFVRGALGVGTLVLSEDNRGQQLSMGGAGMTISIAAGVSLSLDGPIIHMEIASTLLPDPYIEHDGDALAHAGQLSLLRVLFGGTYYFMPINIHLSLSLGMCQASFSSNETFRGGGTGAGFAAQLGVGKEWWFSGDWAAGVAAQFLVASLPDSVDQTATVLSFGVAATVTYN